VLRLVRNLSFTDNAPLFNSPEIAPMPRYSRLAVYALLIVTSRFALASPVPPSLPKPNETAKHGV
jgi:hypothetical protein